MGKSSAAAARSHPAGGCIRLPAGRRAARVASSLSLVRSGQHGWPAARDQQPRAAQQHSWLQRLRSVEGLKNLLFLFVEREFILLEFSVCSVELVCLFRCGLWGSD